MGFKTDMSTPELSADVSVKVKRLISDIIEKNDLKSTSKIIYYPGTEAGDAYTSKTYVVDISDVETSISLFLKCALDFGDNLPSARVKYTNEIYFYKTIFPTYEEFLKCKGVTDYFQNVPVCFGFDETTAKEIIAMENLRQKGYTLLDRFACMNDEHLMLTLRTFAKFHATSFAMKDQRKDLHEEFCKHSPNLFTLEKSFPKMFSNIAKAFVEKLDPIQDEDILEKCYNPSDEVYDQLANQHSYLADYSILVKGDCWVNNMLILYKNNNREHPKHIMLIDWQCIMRGSPVHDIEALFYAVASIESVANYKYYMELYYEELSKRIKELGSDPEILYPRRVFEKEWVDYGVFALGIFMGMIKIMLLETESVPAFTTDMEKDEMENMFAVVTDNEEEYVMRMKYVVRHVMDIGVL